MEDADTLDPYPDSLNQEQATPVEQFLTTKVITAEKVRCSFVPPQKRKTLSSVISGKAVTKAPVVKNITCHLSQQKTAKHSNALDLSKESRKKSDSGKGKGKVKKTTKTFVPPFK